MAGLLARHGDRVIRDADLLETAVALGSPVRHRSSLRHGRVLVAGRG